MSMLPSDEEELVRIAYARSVAKLAQTARRFLDITNFAKQVKKLCLECRHFVRPVHGALSRGDGCDAHVHCRRAFVTFFFVDRKLIFDRSLKQTNERTNEPWDPRANHVRGGVG